MPTKTIENLYLEGMRLMQPLVTAVHRESPSILDAYRTFESRGVRPTGELSNAFISWKAGVFAEPLDSNASISLNNYQRPTSYDESGAEEFAQLNFECLGDSNLPKKSQNTNTSIVEQLIESISLPNLSSRNNLKISILDQLSNRQTEQYVYDLQRKEVRAFSKLSKGWNSYDAEAPGENAIALALRFISLVERHNYKIDWIAPSVDDSVMLIVNAPSGEQEWEFFGDGDTAVMYRDGNGTKAYIDLAESQFEGFLTR